MRAMFGIVSLLVVGAVAAFYFTTAQPELQPGQYQKIQSQAEATAKLMQHDPQADVDAASGSSSSSPATNAPPSGN